MKILITGSTGFIGELLVRELEKKHEIVEFSRTLGMELNNREQVEKALKGVQAVIHLAAEIDETKSSQEIWKTNVEGTKILLEASAKESLVQFIFLSTVGVYGSPKKGQVLTESSICHPETAYEKSKKAAEELVLSYQEVIPVTILRSAIVLGANKYWLQIFKTVKKGFPLIGSGSNQWQVIYVKDLVNAIVFVLNNPNALGETFIVSERKGKTLKGIVELIAKEVGRKEIKSIPVWMGMIAGYFFWMQSKLTGKKAILIPAHIRRMLKERNYSTEKLNRIGWKSWYGTEAMIRETYLAFQKEGLL